jgi:hypothetical protein
MLYKGYKLLAALFILLAFHPIIGQAEENDELGFMGYYISPGVISIKAKQGETINSQMSIKNDTDKPINVICEFKDVEKRENQLIFRDDIPSQLSIAKWASTKQKEIQLKPRSAMELPFDLIIPKDAEIGEHVGVLSIRFKGVEGAQNVSTELLPAVYVLVTDENGNANIRKGWELVTFKADRWNGGPVLFTVRNTGNVHLESTGTIVLRDIFTGKEKTIEIPRENVLKDSEKTISANWKPEDWFGIYDVTIKFSMDGEKVQKIDKIFFVLPLIITIILFIIFVIFTVLPIWIYRLTRKIRKIEKQSTQSTQS